MNRRYAKHSIRLLTIHLLHSPTLPLTYLLLNKPIPPSSDHIFRFFVSQASRSIFSSNGSSVSKPLFSGSSRSPSSLASWSPLIEPRLRSSVVVKAIESDGEIEKPSALMQTLTLGSLFGLWYLFNIYFNIYNKQVLKVFPNPVTVTLVQFAVGTSLVLFMWGLNLYWRPKISGAQLIAILPLPIVHTLGNLFTNMSRGKMAVSFTHTIKAMEPFFSLVLSAMFLGEVDVVQLPTLWVVSSLVPIVGGVALLLSPKLLLIVQWLQI